MSRSSPGRPDLDNLRRMARELCAAALAGDPAAHNRFANQLGTDPAEPPTLAAARWVIAREHGYTDWARLRAALTARSAPDLATLAEDFLTASISGQDWRAVRLLARHPALATFDLRTAVALGELATVQDLLAGHPGRAVRPDRVRGWPPLLYVCHSRWHRIRPARAEGMLQAAWLLLEIGASANSTNGAPLGAGYRSALYGAAGIADNPAIAGLLLRYGAEPNDGLSVAHAAGQPDPASLRVLLEHGATVAGTNAVAAAIAPGGAAAVRLLLAAGGDPGRQPGNEDGRLVDGSVNPLPLAVAECGVDVVEQLLAAGADPNAPGTDHRSPVRGAARRGNLDVVRLLVRYGAQDDSTELDRFLGACLRADRAGVNRLLTTAPRLLARLSAEDLASIVDAAGLASVAAVHLLLDLGFPINAGRVDGATALHAAARAGRSNVVAVLLARGAAVNAADGRTGRTPLAWASLGSGARRPGSGDWVGVVTALLAAGSATSDAWVPGQPPSEAVARLLVEHGIDEPDPDELDELDDE